MVIFNSYVKLPEAMLSDLGRHLSGLLFDYWKSAANKALQPDIRPVANSGASSSYVS